jgi:hypothetical protein
MVDLAIQHKCPILIKNGKNGKWYLKGQGKTMEFLRSEIARKQGLSREGVCCWLLEGF